MYITIHVYSNNIEYGNIDVMYDETNDSLMKKISEKFNIEDFCFEEGFEVSSACNDDNVYVYYDKVKEAKLVVDSYLKVNQLIFDDIFMQALIDSGMINASLDDMNNSPLHVASYYGLDEIVRILIENGADVNITNKIGDTALHRASQRGHNKVVQMLITYGANVNISDTDLYNTALHDASTHGYNDIVQTLIATGLDVNDKNIHWRTPLHLASFNGHNNVVQTLIGAGADVNVQDNLNETPLHYVSSVNYYEMLPILLSAGANINIQNNKRETPLYIALYRYDALYGYDALYDYNNMSGIMTVDAWDEIVQMLIEAGADINLQCNDGFTLLTHLSNNNCKIAIKKLIKLGVDIYRQDDCRKTVLHHASYDGNLEVINVLIETAKNWYNDMSPWCYSSMRGFINIQDEDGMTALHYASCRNHDKVVQTLIAAGADINLRNNKDMTALQAAEYSYNKR